jgi:signal transduction histidine kinase
MSTMWMVPMSLNELTGPPADEPAGHVWQVRHEERQRLSCDLHDTLGPALAGIRLRLDTVAARLGNEPELRSLVADTAAETVRTVAELHRIVDDLGPGDLRLGLPEALRRLAARLEGTDFAITLDVPDAPPPLPEALADAVYRIASEGLTNALYHAAGAQARVRLTTEPDHVVLEIADDGIGLTGVPPSRGTGLSSMRKRAREAGGRCDVLSRREGQPGTLVRAVLPRRAA